MLKLKTDMSVDRAGEDSFSVAECKCQHYQGNETDLCWLEIPRCCCSQERT